MNASPPRRDFAESFVGPAALCATFQFDRAAAACEELERRFGGEGANGWDKAQIQRLREAIAYNRNCYLLQLMGRLHPGGRQDLGDAPIGMAGAFDVSVLSDRIEVFGHVGDGSEWVCLFLAEFFIGLVRTEPSGSPALPGRRRFRVRLQGGALRLFPPTEAVRITASTGPRVLLRTSGDLANWTKWTNGKGGLMDRLREGAVLSSHGELSPVGKDASIAGWLVTYQEVRQAMARHFGRPVFLYYGSMLGAVREGRVIGHDDDLDVAFLARGTTAEEVKAELAAAIRMLLGLGPGYLIQTLSGFFKLRTPEGGTIDVFAAWHDGERLWSAWTTCLDCDPGILAEMREIDFHGATVLVPKRAEDFLALKYGPGWRVPDPGYRAGQRQGIEYPFRRLAFSEEELRQISAEARAAAGGAPIGELRRFPG
jgi:hypothetical protein